MRYGTEIIPFKISADKSLKSLLNTAATYNLTLITHTL
jgi:hypothetical protein